MNKKTNSLGLDIVGNLSKVSEHDALGHSRRAAGIWQHRHLLARVKLYVERAHRTIIIQQRREWNTARLITVDEHFLEKSK